MAWHVCVSEPGLKFVRERFWGSNPLEKFCFWLLKVGMPKSDGRRLAGYSYSPAKREGCLLIAVFC